MVKADFAAGTVRGKPLPAVVRHAPVERTRMRSDEPQTMPLEIIEEVQ